MCFIIIVAIVFMPLEQWSDGGGGTRINFRLACKLEWLLERKVGWMDGDAWHFGITSALLKVSLLPLSMLFV